MKRKFLEDLGLEKGAIDKIMDAHGEAVNAAKATAKTDLDTANATIDTLKGQLKDTNATIKTLQSKEGNSEELQKQLDTLTQKYDDDTKALQDQIAGQALQTAIAKEFEGAGVKNTKAVQALMDMDKVKLDGETLLGFKEQLAAVRKSDAYLFEDKGDPGGGGNPGDPKDPDTKGALPSDVTAAIWGNMAPPE